MTQLRLIDKLISLYSSAIKASLEMQNTKKIFEYLQSNNIEFGVCNVSLIRFKMFISNCDWMKRNKIPDAAYWYQTPMECHTKEEIIETLEHRLNILKKVRIEEGQNESLILRIKHNIIAFIEKYVMSL